MKPFEDMYDYRSLMTAIIYLEHEQAYALGEWLLSNINPSSVIDIGCGPGIYLAPFELEGCDTLGIDGCIEGGKSITNFERVDLRFPYTPPRKFELSICFEVVEHLAEEYESILLDTVCKSSDMIAWSAAIPNQGGEDHVNEKPVQYWLDEFKKRGYIIHEKNTSMIDFLKTLPRHCSPWLKNNTFLVYKIA